MPLRIAQTIHQMVFEAEQKKTKPKSTMQMLQNADRGKSEGLATQKYMRLVFSVVITLENAAPR